MTIEGLKLYLETAAEDRAKWRLKWSVECFLLCDKVPVKQVKKLQLSQENNNFCPLLLLLTNKVLVSLMYDILLFYNIKF